MQLYNVHNRNVQRQTKDRPAPSASAAAIGARRTPTLSKLEQRLHDWTMYMTAMGDGTR